MTILSVHLGHNSSICLLKNGHVKKYFLIERLTRKKYDYDEKVVLSLVKNICQKLKIDIICISNFNPPQGDNFIVTIFEECKNHNPNIKLVLQQDHHLNHASIAFYNSKFDESLVIVADGSGSKIEDNMVEVESVFAFNREKNTLIYKNVVESFSSWDLPWGKVGVGGLYDMASVLIGNTPDDCGKAMGLSSYGLPNKLFENLFLQQSPDIKPIKKVCISGGYGMNIVSNYYYLQRFPNVEFYFEPVCNDNGVSIGAAMNTYVELTGKIPNPIETTAFHGTHYDISSYKGITTSIKDIANLLYQDKSIAVYTGFAEAGQRALGNRSIFFNSLNPNAKDPSGFSIMFNPDS